MKLRILTWFLTKILGVDEEAEKADMHLPVKIAAFGLAMILGGFVLVGAFIVNKLPVALVFAVVCFAFAPFALLCYKNQRIYVLSDEEFEYSTLFGNKKVYRFADIKSLRPNRDSMTLFVGEEKVHIESSAVLSERLTNIINEQLRKNSEAKNTQK